MGGFSLKTVLQPFPLPPHPLLIRGSQGLTCTQSSVVKLIIILLWKIRKSFCSKYQIPQNHMWQLLVYVGGRGECVKILTLSPSVFRHLDKKGHKKKGGKKKKKVSNACEAETNSKANIWIFLRLKNFPQLKTHHTRHLTRVWICSDTLASRESVFLSRMYPSDF